MAFTNVVCVYNINCTGQRTAAQTSQDMQDEWVPIPPEFLAITGAVVSTDVVSSAGNIATRTITFDVSSDQFQFQFPNDQLSPFYGLMTLPIQAYCNAPVVEAQPVGS